MLHIEHDLNKRRCTRNDGNPGHCLRPSNCTQMKRILEDKKRNAEFTSEQLEYIRGSGSSDCEKVCESVSV